MNPLDLMLLAFHFVRTRWGLRFHDRAALQAWQRARMARFLSAQLPLAPFYRAFAGRPLDELPVIDKGMMLANFAGMNQAGITLEEATAFALAGETSRDFAPGLRGMTVGLSSGTQGPRGIFLASARERAKWAGILLARVLPASMLRRVVFGGEPVKVAFFLRANSNLYTTLKSRRIDFRFYDLFEGLEPLLSRLQAQQPDILVAPSTVLGRIATLVLDGRLTLSPSRVIAVAEVLEPDDREKIGQAFGLAVHQIYQCTEGFLGFTCEEGTLHLNEEFVHIEPQWLDDEKTRFVPIVTDFSRTTQLIVRYRLNDVLRVRASPCGCGRVTLALDAVEGRSDDVLWLREAASGALAAVYPDMVRHAVMAVPQSLPDYRIEQHGMQLRVAVAGNDPQALAALMEALQALALRQRLIEPDFESTDFVAQDFQAKRRRIICKIRPLPP